jgi:hypothetical protein
MAKQKLFLDDLRIGDTAKLGAKGTDHTWSAIFLGFSLDERSNGFPPTPRATFCDVGDQVSDTWDAYLYEGRFCIGTSAQELKVLERSPIVWEHTSACGSTEQATIGAHVLRVWPENDGQRFRWSITSEGAAHGGGSSDSAEQAKAAAIAVVLR